MEFYDLETGTIICGWEASNGQAVTPTGVDSETNAPMYALDGLFTESDLRGLLLAMSNRYDRSARDVANDALDNMKQWREA